MLCPVTVGLDGSPESLAAAHWAAEEALRRSLPLRLVQVWEWRPYTQVPLASGPAEQRQWSQRVLDRAEDALRARHPDLDITGDQIAGAPASVLPLVAEEADVLVLGSRGLGGLAGFVLGSVAASVVGHTGRPVVLVRAGQEDGTEDAPRDVVLGLDLTRPCDGLIAFAFQAAERRGAPLRAVTCVPPAPVYGYYPAVIEPEPEEERLAREAARLSDALRPWRSKFPAVDVRERVLPGRPAHLLVEEAAGAALLVLGRRARDTRVGARTGTVTRSALHHSTAPVAVVPHD